MFTGAPVLRVEQLLLGVVVMLAYFHVDYFFIHVDFQVSKFAGSYVILLCVDVIWARKTFGYCTLSVSKEPEEKDAVVSDKTPDVVQPAVRGHKMYTCVFING